MKDYARITSPLHELTKISEPLLWTEERDKAFETLKEHLTTGPILAMSQDVGAYTLDVDASNCAAGAVLQQEQEVMLRVIAYASKAFTGADKTLLHHTQGVSGHDIRNKELPAIPTR